MTNNNKRKSIYRPSDTVIGLRRPRWNDVTARKRHKRNGDVVNIGNAHFNRIDRVNMFITHTHEELFRYNDDGKK